MKVAITILAVLLTSACADAAPAPVDRNPIDVIALQAQADDACICEMRSGDYENCWDSFDETISTIEYEELGSASEPLSSTIICIPDADDKCVSLKFSLVGGGKRDFVCTEDQIDEINGLYERLLAERGNNKGVTLIPIAERISEMREKLPSRE